jgi:iron complex transport system ATP-binding protein
MVRELISLVGVHARYSAGAADVLSDVSISVQAGGITAVVGPNGSGKSSLVKTLLRRLAVRRGTVQVEGRRLEDWPRRELATRLAVITQREEAAFPMTVEEYVTLGRYPKLGEWSAPAFEDRAAIDESLSITDIVPMARRRIDELSGGEWQRVRLARALAQGGAALVLDEPTAFLDIAHEMAVFELLASLARERGQAVLLVSHQLNLVSRYADHIVLLDRGRVAAEGAPDDVMHGPILERVYGWPLVVTRDPAIGAPMLVPLRSRRQTSRRSNSLP